jgi:hypothetical protein
MPPHFAQPIPVPATSDPELKLIAMHAVSVEPRLGAQLMRALAEAAPLTGLQHVKRIRKVADCQSPMLHVLLCREKWTQQLAPDADQQQPTNAAQEAPSAALSDAGSSAKQPQLPPAVAEVVHQHELQTFLVQVRATGHYAAGMLCLAGGRPRTLLGTSTPACLCSPAGAIARSLQAGAAAGVVQALAPQLAGAQHQPSDGRSADGG